MTMWKKVRRFHSEGIVHSKSHKTLTKIQTTFWKNSTQNNLKWRNSHREKTYYNSIPWYDQIKHHSLLIIAHNARTAINNKYSKISTTMREKIPNCGYRDLIVAYIASIVVLKCIVRCKLKQSDIKNNRS